MKVYIITDLEGPALISRFNQTRDVDPAEKPRWMALLTGEVNACIDGILDFDPDAEVIVWDGHGSGGILEEQFHRDAKLIARGPISAPYHLDDSFDALMFVGQHARAGTDGVLCHTYSSKTIEYYKINGVELGEFGCRALMAGTMGVPAIFIAGDDVAVEEARELAPNIVGAAVKQALGRELAIHLSHGAACELIRERAREACERLDEIEPYLFEGPYTQEIRYLEGAGIQGALDAGWEFVDNRTVRKTADDICELRV
ncbi:MAG: M55 family metallopeptidase [Armatimonadota bacterium]|nr:M55 family metallopeptidase [Armatimonadota bacterium]